MDEAQVGLVLDDVSGGLRGHLGRAHRAAEFGGRGHHHHFLRANFRIEDAKGYHAPRMHPRDLVRQDLQILGVDILTTDDDQVLLPVR